MSARLPHTPLDQLTEQQRAIYVRITGGSRSTGTPHFPLTAEDGTLNGPFGIMLHEPELGSNLERLGAAIRYRTNLSPRVREIAILQVAHAMDSEFEWWAHAKVAKAAGLTEAELDALASGTLVGEDDLERASAAFCQILLRDQHQLTNDEFATMSAQLSPASMIELTVLVGYYRTLAQLMAVFDIGVPPMAPPSDIGTAEPPAESRGV
ncbi:MULTISPECIES: carboxymuconolactone decarboxylase family protein [Mycobacterium]|uniref:carboxymuconolactone decarboxylase family protein n=1 Tax=Mycobacterium TaxID=1763 RepID=UPI00200C6E19|nr:MULTISPECIES: carboxymuconolactone decarboxylase family protein [Mycobacterium]UQB93125.1 carboxymuconolactone decarboxylase family protein [Mycobacterium intracellulare]WSE46158.1 carboxymuconolactone decarboxylase family protein [Mycobacterium sp. 3-98]